MGLCMKLLSEGFLLEHLEMNSDVSDVSWEICSVSLWNEMFSWRHFRNTLYVDNILWIRKLLCVLISVGIAYTHSMNQNKNSGIPIFDQSMVYIMKIWWQYFVTSLWLQTFCLCTNRQRGPIEMVFFCVQLYQEQLGEGTSEDLEKIAWKNKIRGWVLTLSLFEW